MNGRLRISFALALVSLISGRVALGQSLEGNFQNFDPWWLGPGGTLGVIYNGTGTISIDRDGNGSTESSYSLPAGLTGSEQFRLTPTREVLYAFGTACASGVNVYFYSIPEPPGTLTLIDSACSGNSINQQGFYDTGISADPPGQIVPTAPPYIHISPQRIAYVEWTDPVNSDAQHILWFDLVNGTHTGSSFSYSASLGYPLKVAPSGTHAFVQEDLSSPGDTDYRLVDLCPGSVGNVINQGGFPIMNQTEQLTAAIGDVTGGNLHVRVTRPDTTVVADYPTSDCLASSPPPTGACCQPCAVCTIVTPSACAAITGAFWLGAGTACTSCPQFPSMSVTKTGPAGPIEQMTPFSYTLTYRNNGSATAGGVSVMDTVPTTATFVSASNGGTYNSSTRVVTWSVGNVTACQSGSVTLTLRGNCNAASVVNSTYSVRWNPGITSSGSPSVTTTLSPPSAAAVNISINSSPSETPLLRGDTITHTITLSNTIAQNRPNLSFAFQPGSASDFDSVINNGGGTFSGTSTITWTGSVGPSASVDIVFLSRIRACPPTSVTQEQLNSGQPINVLNTCSTVLGSATAPGPFPLQRPTSASLIALPPVNPPIGGTQLARPGATIDIALSISNLLSTPQPSVSGSVSLSSDLTPVGNPPFISPTDPAATYDAGTRTISWSSSLAAMQSIQITFRVTLSTGGPCRTGMTFVGSTGTCQDLTSGLSLALVPQEPVESHLVGVNPYGFPQGSVWTFRPGIDSTQQNLFCSIVELWTGLGRGPGGDLWITGVPNLRLNPATLDYQEFPSDFAVNTLGIQPFGFLDDVAIDPADGTAVFIGHSQGANGAAAVRRYNPASGAVVFILDGNSVSPAINNFERVVIDPEGFIAATTGAEIVRINPANPTAIQRFSAPGVYPFSLALDTDGDYIASSFVWGAATTRPLIKVNRQTGAVTTLVSDLNSLIPQNPPYIGSAVASNGLIYLTPYDNGGAGAIINRGPPATAQILPFAGANSDIVLVEAPSQRGDMNCDGRVDGLDVAAFAIAVIQTSQYSALYPSCDILHGDFTTDNITDASDLSGFVSCLLMGICP